MMKPAKSIAVAPSPEEVLRSGMQQMESNVSGRLVRAGAMQAESHPVTLAAVLVALKHAHAALEDGVLLLAHHPDELLHCYQVDLWQHIKHSADMNPSAGKISLI